MSIETESKIDTHGWIAIIKATFGCYPRTEKLHAELETLNKMLFENFSESERLVIKARHVDTLTYKEIADMLGKINGGAPPSLYKTKELSEKAMRRLRHPKNSDIMYQFLFIDDEGDILF